MRAEEHGVGPEVRGALREGGEDTAFGVREAPALIYEGKGFGLGRDYGTTGGAEDVADVCAGVLVAWKGKMSGRWEWRGEDGGKGEPPGFFGLRTPLTIGGSTAWYSTATRSGAIFFVGDKMPRA